MELNINIQNENGNDSSELQRELASHKSAAEQQQALLSKAEEDCKEEGSGSSTRTICIDLQQILPCPRLKNQKAYYKKKLNLYNLCIYDLNTCKANYFLWDETMALKGSNEINSCLLKGLELNQSDGFKNLRIFADNCLGQNKNIYVTLNCLRLLQIGGLDSIKIEFMVAGHSYMPCNRTFGSIENKLRLNKIIDTPDEYATIIKTAIRNGITVIRMTQEDFFDIKMLKDKVTVRKPKKFLFTEGRTFTLSKAKPWEYHIKKSSLTSETVSLKKGKKGPPSRAKGRPKSPTPLLSSAPLRRAYANQLKLDYSKIEHLQQLRSYLQQTGRTWIDQLVNKQSSASVVTDQAGEEETPVVGDNNAQDEDLLDYAAPVPYFS
ncbi:unnamed protein product [Meganyctiphanes norvegica]|uniref:DUF7869 domain-containing protein n=1 Tax=Meganyctiphanes norvegica TaxID=48144 RepID=A0AAV2SIU2_MEGNR